MKNRRKEYFGNYAADWDKNFTAEDLQVLSDLIAEFGLKPGDRVVDLGCGTGVLFDILRREIGISGLVVGIDFSLAMVRKAHQNFPFRNCPAVNAEAENLPLKDANFDMVISFASFPHFSNHPRVVREISRVLRKGSRLYILHLLGSEELAQHHHDADAAVADDCLPDEDCMKKILGEAGFTAINIIDKSGLYLVSAEKV